MNALVEPVRPAAADAPARDVNFLADFNPTGIGRHSEYAFFGLLRNRRAGLAPYYVRAGDEQAMRHFFLSPRSRSGSNLMFWLWPAQTLRQMPGRKIGWLFFESDRLPASWIEQMRLYDELWMPSGWARDVLLAHGLPESKIRVVPAGVDVSVYRPAPRAHERFTFLTVGKYEKRKSIDEAIEAFSAEFPAAEYPDVEFWIKADHPTFPDRIQALIARHGADARLQFFHGVVSDEKMAALYNRADAFVFPTKAEGFGLPTIEALACGLPVITTAYSAQTEFLGHVEGLYRPVEFDLDPIVDEDYAHFHGRAYAGAPFGQWAIPNPRSLRQAMREVHENPQLWRERALEASARIHAAFSWDKIGMRAVDVLLGAS